MKRVLLAAAAVILSGAALSGVVLAQPGVQQSAQPAGPAELRIPARKQQAPVPALLQSRANEIYNTTCAACHGIDGHGDGPTAQRLGWTLMPLNEELPQLSDGALNYRIAVGTVGTGMPGFAGTLAERDRWDLVNYLRSRFDDLVP